VDLGMITILPLVVLGMGEQGAIEVQLVKLTGVQIQAAAAVGFDGVAPLAQAALE